MTRSEMIDEAVRRVYPFAKKPADTTGNTWRKFWHANDPWVARQLAGEIRAEFARIAASN